MDDCEFVNDINLGYYCTECGDYVLKGDDVYVYVGVCADCYDDIIDNMISYEEYIRD